MHTRRKDGYVLPLVLWSVVIVDGILGLIFHVSVEDHKNTEAKYALSTELVRRIRQASQINVAAQAKSHRHHELPQAAAEGDDSANSQPKDLALGFIQATTDTAYAKKPYSIPLVEIRLADRDADAWARPLAGMIIWLPCAFACAVAYTHHIVFDTSLSPFAAAIIAGTLWASPLGDGAPAWLVIGGLLLLLLACARRPATSSSFPGTWIPKRFRLATLVSWIVVATSAGVSVSAHRIYSNYADHVPVPYTTAKENETVNDALTNSAKTPLTDSDDPIVKSVSRLRSLNSLDYTTIWKSDSNLFIGNCLAADLCIVSILLYVLIFSTQATSMIIKFRLQRAEPGFRSPPFLVAFLLLFYLTTACVFALRFYNSYVSDAARQNIVSAWAWGLKAHAADLKLLEAQQRDFGSSKHLDDALKYFRASHHGEPQDTTTKARALRLAGAEYWASSSIAQERIRLRPNGLRPNRTELTLVTNQTLWDMVYFSFVSFTTTGYGDIRPISHEMRLWTIVENVTQIVFVAIFFAVTLGIIITNQAARLGARMTICVVGFIAILSATATVAQDAPAYCRPLNDHDRPSVMVVIDDSSSMQALFQGARPVNFAQHLAQLSKRLVAHTSARFYGLSRLDTRVEFARLSKAQFYEASETPLTSVFRRVARTRDDAVVLISDLRNSERGLQAERFSDAVADVSMRLPYSMVIGLRVGRPQGLPDAQAFIVVFARTAAVLNRVEECGLRPNVDDAPLPFRSRPFYSILSASRVMDGDPNSVWRSARGSGAETIRNCAAGPAVIESAYTLFKHYGSAPPLLFEVVGLSDVPLTMPEMFCQYVSIIREEPAAVRPTYDATGVCPAAREQVSLEGESILQRLPLEDDDDGTGQIAYGFRTSYPLQLPSAKRSCTYRVELRAGPSHIEPPRWVKEWAIEATKDKTLPDTPSVEVLIRAIIGVTCDCDVFLVHRITLTNAGE